MTLTHPSPNFGERRGGFGVDLVVLHYTVLDRDAALSRLCDQAAEVSAHYLVDRDGALATLVDERHRAWHAGAGDWGGRDDVNSRSVGIELVNCGAEPFSNAQMRTLERLLADLLRRHRLPPQAVIGHSDMAPHRKSDPGPRFDWRRLAMQGLSVWPEPVTPAVCDAAAFQNDLRAFGYPKVDPVTLLAAFRMRFRPWAQGPLDMTDIALAAGLRRFAVDGTAPRA